jgi:23S rRNA (uracil1939-C5)-methyltransferase
MVIERLGARGEGVASSPEGPIFVPYALAGETVLAQVRGGRGELTRVLSASPDRIAPVCLHFSVCGGCAVQSLRCASYFRWKEGLVATALSRAGIATTIVPLLNCHGTGRRRVTLHARQGGDRVRVGFMRARSHELIDIARCPLLAPRLQLAPTIARSLAECLARLGKPLDILITGVANGLDIDLRGCGPLPASQIEALIELAEVCDLARLTNHGAPIALRRVPIVKMGAATVALPPGAFLQATEEAEEAMVRQVTILASGARCLADLYCGVGTFALRLAETAEVHGFDTHLGALRALAAAHRSAGHLRAIATRERDLARQPLTAAELSAFDALVFDPPRAGAANQAHQIARSEVPTVIAVSCNLFSFARDATILAAGGYRLERVIPLDQFRFSPHLEIVAHFVRERKQRRRRLLG